MAGRKRGTGKKVKRKRSKAMVKKRVVKRRTRIKVDEHTLILKIIDDASKELNKQNDKNFLEMAYTLRDNINKANGKGFSDLEKKEVKEFLRRAKIMMLLNDKEEEFRSLSRIEKDILKAFRR